MTDNILILLNFIFLPGNTICNEINDLTFKSDRLLAEQQQGLTQERAWASAVNGRGP